MALIYHQGQIEVQTQANTRRVADMLATWVGPAGEFCATADMIVLGTAGERDRFRFMALSGAAPLIEVAGLSSLFLEVDPRDLASVQSEAACGGIAINLAMARRARLNGTLRRVEGGLLLEASEAFTNCRKYLAPSAPLESARHFGPETRQVIPLDDARIEAMLARAETSFLATVSPDGVVDVSHRGGPPGFLRYQGGALDWEEYVGDGMLKSAGNVRATARISLLVPDFETGDAIELTGTARVELIERQKRPRTEGLLQHAEDFPIQGRMSCRIDAAYRLSALTHPRRRLEKRQKVTSASTTHDQAPR